VSISTDEALTVMPEATFVGRAAKSARAMAFGVMIPVALVCTETFPAVAAAATSCPATLGDHRLIRVNVYDGPPSELAALIPGDGGWKLGQRPVSKQGFYLGCEVQGIKEVYPVPLPDGVRSCRFYNYPVVRCE